MNDRLCFVQFLHPGGEHWPDNDIAKHWNSGPHRRKFLRSPGLYLSDDTVREGDLAFWGEWEAQSEVVAPLAALEPSGPRWLYQPYLHLPPSYLGLQNTDPFVFGDQFHYTGCLQHTRNGPTQLRNLSPGSVILFGSCIRRQKFVVDTIFVVERFVDHSFHDFHDTLRDVISHVYKSVTIDPWYTNLGKSDAVHRLYFGATHDAPVDGMFSFFPCLPLEAAPHGFERPEILIHGSITPNQTQNKKLTFRGTTGQMKELWQEVVRQVESQKLKLGIRAELPGRR